jgi:uncharacterized protein (TIGR02246 family)
MSDQAEVAAAEEEWGRAMITNDAEAIGRYMADDWTIVGPDGSVHGKAHFLELVKSGQLTHHTMTADEIEVRVYGDAAVVTCRSVSAGAYQGRPFRELERVSDFFVKEQGRWVCVRTHLSRIAEK